MSFTNLGEGEGGFFILKEKGEVKGEKEKKTNKIL